MGAVLAKFRKEKSTTEILEGLEEKIQQIEKYSINTQEQRKRIVGNFLAISIGLYVVAFIVFYFVYFPPTWKERVLYSVPLFLFPFVIILLRRLFTWYFERKLNKNSNKLRALRAEKKKILEQVMDKETYKVAVNLLARFGDKNSGNTKSLYAMTPRTSNTSVPRVVLSQATPLPGVSSGRISNRMPGDASQAIKTSMSTPLTSYQLMSRSPLNGRGDGEGSGGERGVVMPSGQELRRRTPFPVINQQGKGVLDRIVDVLIGDGPQDRFAMICKDCYAHNGMALKEDFEYTTFRCAFCNALNPARKARPVAPRLPGQLEEIIHPSDSESSNSPCSETDEDGFGYRRSPSPEPQTQCHEVPQKNPRTELSPVKSAIQESLHSIEQTEERKEAELDPEEPEDITQLKKEIEDEMMSRLKEEFEKLLLPPEQTHPKSISSKESEPEPEPEPENDPVVKELSERGN